MGEIWLDNIGGIFAAIMYFMIQGQAFGFFLFYLKRMITVGFLIIIAPLITITYSIDKIGDGKAQALNAWLKEISYNVLIQPFHCVIYLAFFGAIYEILIKGFGNITAYILAFVVLKFMREAEGILRKIFHFEANSMPSITEPAKGFAAATGKFAQVGMKAGSAFSNFRAAGGMKGITNGFKDIAAKREVKKEFDSKKEGGMSFKEFKKTEEYQKRVEEKKKTAREISSEKHNKRTEKARRIYDKKENRDGAYDEMIEEKARKAYDAKHGDGEYDKLDETEKNKQKSQIQQAENTRILANSNSVKKTINGAKTMANTFRQSDAGKAIIAYGKDSIKVASALALGSFAYGMTGNLTDGISFGQVGYGIAYGALEGTTKTATDDTCALTRQFAHNNNISPEEMQKKIQDFINECHSMDFAGMFKKIHDDQVKAIEKLKEIVGDNAKEIMTQMIGRTKTGQEYDISELIAEYGPKDLEDSKKFDAINVVKEFSDLLIKSQVAGQYNVVKSGGMDVDSFGRKVTNNYHTTENNTTNYIYNHEENKYENRYQSNH